MNHRFDPNGWKYGESRMEDLVEKVRRHVPGASLPTNQGGKAFGLSLAKALVGDAFTVPEWFVGTPSHPLPSREKLEDHFLQGAFVRSNAPDEDWGDPRAGLHESKYGSFAYSFNKVVDQLLADCGGVVVQAHTYGVGVVIDLGWSELLSRNVLRVAVGGPSMEGGRTVYTSPTWDNEAAVGIFDAHTGEAIVDLQPHFLDLRRIIDKMVGHVVPKLVEWDIDFGLQFEFLSQLNDMRDRLKAQVPAYRPHDDLVQIRPSPGALQGTVELPDPTGALLVTTGKVNMPGSTKAEVVLIEGHNRRGPIDLSRELHVAGEYGTEHEELDPLKPLIKDKIVLWDPGALERYGGSFYQVLGAWRLGAVAQLSARAVFINSAHGTVLPSYRTSERIRPVFEEARGAGLLVAIGHEALRVLERICWKSSPTLQILSDGLVGQVYRL